MFVVASAIIASKRSVVKRENLNRNVFQFDWLRVGLVSWITPALTERTKSIEVVKMESDTMGGTTIRRLANPNA